MTTFIKFGIIAAAIALVAIIYSAIRENGAGMLLGRAASSSPIGAVTVSSTETQSQSSQTNNQPATAANQPVEGQQSNGWHSFVDKMYHFSLSYPGTMQLAEGGTASLDIFNITIDPAADPIVVCAADNIYAWTSRTMYEEWKTTSPVPGSQEFPCASYPSYAHISGSNITIDNLPAYQVTSFRGEFETMCSYVASHKALLAICLPPENPSSTAWKSHFDTSAQIVKSVVLSQ
jgi:hypothetical protein